MKISRIASLVLLLFLTPFSSSFAQQTSLLGPSSIVTGQCAGHEKEPGCVVPSLFGPNGLTLAPNPQFSHYAHFIGKAQETLNQTLSTAIATQLAILPLISPSSGFTYRYDSASGAFVRSSSSFGPIYTERAETIGRGRVTVGAAYQRFRFDMLDGIDLHKVPAVFSHLADTGPNGTAPAYEADVISTTNDINLKIDQTIVYATVGITDRLDVSIAAPISSVRLNATSNATIIRVSGPTFTLPGIPGTFDNPHQFLNGTLQNTFNSSGSASGLGDITFRVKGGLLSTENVRLAAGMDFRVPSGDERQLLGSGATGFRPFLAVSAGQRFSPHFNIGYQWNGDSILAGNITGTTFGENAAGQPTLTTGPATKASLPDELLFAGGFDTGVTDRLTVVVDYLGQTVFHAPRVFTDTFVTQNIPGGTGALTLPTIRGGKKTTTLNNGSVGLKYNLFSGLLITGNVLFRMDDHGLRQDVTPLAGISYTFGR